MNSELALQAQQLYEVSTANNSHCSTLTSGNDLSELHACHASGGNEAGNERLQFHAQPPQASSSSRVRCQPPPLPTLRWGEERIDTAVWQGCMEEEWASEGRGSNSGGSSASQSAGYRNHQLHHLDHQRSAHTKAQTRASGSPSDAMASNKETSPGSTFELSPMHVEVLLQYYLDHGGVRLADVTDAVRDVGLNLPDQFPITEFFKPEHNVGPQYQSLSRVVSASVAGSSSGPQSTPGEGAGAVAETPIDPATLLSPPRWLDLISTVIVANSDAEREQRHARMQQQIAAHRAATAAAAAATKELATTRVEAVDSSPSRDRHHPSLSGAARIGVVTQASGGASLLEFVTGAAEGGVSTGYGFIPGRDPTFSQEYTGAPNGVRPAAAGRAIPSANKPDQLHRTDTDTQLAGNDRGGSSSSGTTPNPTPPQPNLISAGAATAAGTARSLSKTEAMMTDEQNQCRYPPQSMHRPDEEFLRFHEHTFRQLFTHCGAHATGSTHELRLTLANWHKTLQRKQLLLATSTEPTSSTAATMLTTRLPPPPVLDDVTRTIGALAALSNRSMDAAAASLPPPPTPTSQQEPPSISFDVFRDELAAEVGAAQADALNALMLLQQPPVQSEASLPRGAAELTHDNSSSRYQINRNGTSSTGAGGSANNGRRKRAPSYFFLSSAGRALAPARPPTLAMYLAAMEPEVLRKVAGTPALSYLRSVGLVQATVRFLSAELTEWIRQLRGAVNAAALLAGEETTAVGGAGGGAPTPTTTNPSAILPPNESNARSVRFSVDVDDAEGLAIGAADSYGERKEIRDDPMSGDARGIVSDSRRRQRSLSSTRSGSQQPRYMQPTRSTDDEISASAVARAKARRLIDDLRKNTVPMNRYECYARVEPEEAPRVVDFLPEKRRRCHGSRNGGGSCYGEEEDSDGTHSSQSSDGLPNMRELLALADPRQVATPACITRKNGGGGSQARHDSNANPRHHAGYGPHQHRSTSARPAGVGASAGRAAGLATITPAPGTFKLGGMFGGVGDATAHQATFDRLCRPTCDVRVYSVARTKAPLPGERRRMRGVTQPAPAATVLGAATSTTTTTLVGTAYTTYAPAPPLTLAPTTSTSAGAAPSQPLPVPHRRCASPPILRPNSSTTHSRGCTDTHSGCSISSSVPPHLNMDALSASQPLPSPPLRFGVPLPARPQSGNIRTCNAIYSKDGYDYSYGQQRHSSRPSSSSSLPLSRSAAAIASPSYRAPLITDTCVSRQFVRDGSSYGSGGCGGGYERTGSDRRRENSGERRVEAKGPMLMSSPSRAPRPPTVPRSSSQPRRRDRQGGCRGQRPTRREKTAKRTVMGAVPPPHSHSRLASGSVGAWRTVSRERTASNGPTHREVAVTAATEDTAVTSSVHAGGDGTSKSKHARHHRGVDAAAHSTASHDPPLRDSGLTEVAHRRQNRVHTGRARQANAFSKAVEARTPTVVGHVTAGAAVPKPQRTAVVSAAATSAAKAPTPPKVVAATCASAEHSLHLSLPPPFPERVPRRTPRSSSDASTTPTASAAASDTTATSASSSRSASSTSLLLSPDSSRSAGTSRNSQERQQPPSPPQTIRTVERCHSRGTSRTRLPAASEDNEENVTAAAAVTRVGAMREDFSDSKKGVCGVAASPTRSPTPVGAKDSSTDKADGSYRRRSDGGSSTRDGVCSELSDSEREPRGATSSVIASALPTIANTRSPVDTAQGITEENYYYYRSSHSLSRDRATSLGGSAAQQYLHQSQAKGRLPHIHHRPSSAEDRRMARELQQPSPSPHSGTPLSCSSLAGAAAGDRESGHEAAPAAVLTLSALEAEFTDTAWAPRPPMEATAAGGPTAAAESTADRSAAAVMPQDSQSPSHSSGVGSSPSQTPAFASAILRARRAFASASAMDSLLAASAAGTVTSGVGVGAMSTTAGGASSGFRLGGSQSMPSLTNADVGVNVNVSAGERPLDHGPASLSPPQLPLVGLMSPSDSRRPPLSPMMGRCQAGSMPIRQ